MAQRYYTFNIKEANFPVLSSNREEGYIADTASKTVPNSGIIYAENVLPTTDGLRSLSYQGDVVAGINLWEGEYFLACRYIVAEEGETVRFAHTNLGRCLVNRDEVFPNQWREVGTLPEFAAAPLSFGTVNGLTYIYQSGLGCYTVNLTALTLTSVTLAALNPTEVKGVTASSGYLIAYTKDSIAWSSTIDPTDFDPSQVTGAGGGKVAGIKGYIAVVSSNSQGILIYCDRNVIGGTYTANKTYPFRFSEVSGSKGASTLEAITDEANAYEQYVISPSGIFQLSSGKADQIAPEVHALLVGDIFEYFESEDLQIVQAVGVTIKHKVRLVASRYLIFSYGRDTETGYEAAIVYDLTLNKMGKLVCVHSDILELKGKLAVVTTSGEIKVESGAVGSDGVVITEKLHYSAKRYIGLLEVLISSTLDAEETLVTAQTNITEGRTTESVGVTLLTETRHKRYGFRVTGMSHRLLVTGYFSLNRVQATYMLAGRV